MSKPEQGNLVPDPIGNIIQRDLGAEMRGSYIDYSMSVIVGRALPDVRDGLKPVHRRILYAMHDEGLASNKKYSKCAGVVGEVLKKYHPHGDSSVYDAMVRMVQEFSLLHPLIDGQGNFGSVDGDPPAAYRYTEAGMATNIPPHNLSEVCEAAITLIKDPKIESKELMKIIKGPDFPTGGIVRGKAGIKDYFETGRGSVRIQSKTEIEPMKGNREAIIIHELPFQVNKA